MSEEIIDKFRKRFSFGVNCLHCMGDCHDEPCRCVENAEALQVQKGIEQFILEELADIKQGINWISVKDRLPLENIDILMLCGTVNVGRFDGDRFFSTSCPLPVEVTHWAMINLPETKAV